MFPSEDFTAPCYRSPKMLNSLLLRSHLELFFTETSFQPRLKSQVYPIIFIIEQFNHRPITRLCISRNSSCCYVLFCMKYLSIFFLLLNLLNIFLWLVCLFITLNVSIISCKKTQFMVASKRERPTYNLQIGDTENKKVQPFRYLGSVFGRNKKLSWTVT